MLLKHQVSHAQQLENGVQSQLSWWSCEDLRDLTSPLISSRAWGSFLAMPALRRWTLLTSTTHGSSGGFPGFLRSALKVLELFCKSPKELTGSPEHFFSPELYVIGWGDQSHSLHPAGHRLWWTQTIRVEVGLWYGKNTKQVMAGTRSGPAGYKSFWIIFLGFWCTERACSQCQHSPAL